MFFFWGGGYFFLMNVHHTLSVFGQAPKNSQVFALVMKPNQLECLETAAVTSLDFNRCLFNKCAVLKDGIQLELKQYILGKSAQAKIMRP